MKNNPVVEMKDIGSSFAMLRRTFSFTKPNVNRERERERENNSDNNSRGGSRDREPPVESETKPMLSNEKTTQLALVYGEPMEPRSIVEIISWIVWAVFSLGYAVNIPIIWCVFWGTILPSQHITRSSILFTAWIVFVSYWRTLIRKYSQSNMYNLACHVEYFILTGIMSCVCSNFASYIHTPGPRLFDIGFMLIPEFGPKSAWRPVSDILTAVLPLCMLIYSLGWLDRKRRTALWTDFFRLVTLVYLFRCMVTPLTSMPGPAPHCNYGEEYYTPPTNWSEIATRLGPMYGDYRTCGDLLFSGHAAWTTISMLLFVKQHKNSKLFKIWKLLGILYLLTMCCLVIASRKHYTVDLCLGIMVASLTFFRFQNGWTLEDPMKPSDILPRKYTDVTTADNFDNSPHIV